jgi:hypothetical protein
LKRVTVVEWLREYTTGRRDYATIPGGERIQLHLPLQHKTIPNVVVDFFSSLFRKAQF